MSFFSLLIERILPVPQPLWVTAAPLVNTCAIESAKLTDHTDLDFLRSTTLEQAKTQLQEPFVDQVIGYTTFVEKTLSIETNISQDNLSGIPIKTQTKQIDIVSKYGRSHLWIHVCLSPLEDSFFNAIHNNILEYQATLQPKSSSVMTDETVQTTVDPRIEPNVESNVESMVEPTEIDTTIVDPRLNKKDRPYDSLQEIQENTPTENTLEEQLNIAMNQYIQNLRP